MGFSLCRLKQSLKSIAGALQISWVPELCRYQDEGLELDLDILFQAALLHDVVEDTKVTLGEIENIFGSKVAGIVARLTKTSSEFRETYIQQLRQDSYACVIKLCDLDHNSNLNRISRLTKKDYERVARYRSESGQIQQFLKEILESKS